VDEGGNKIKKLRPDVTSINSYPVFFDFADFDKQWWEKRLRIPSSAYVREPGDKGENFLCSSNTYYPLGGFEIKDYFRIKKSGQYTLTVWPKIYQRSPTSDIWLYRIDIPPVLVKFTATVSD
jgi:hypothetical protein